MDKYFKIPRCPLFRGFTVYGISTSKTTPYHLMSNGVTERMGTTMINALITIPDNLKVNWKDRLDKMIFVYNSTVNKSTWFTRFNLMFSRESRISVLEKIYCYVTLKKKKSLEIKTLLEKQGLCCSRKNSRLTDSCNKANWRAVEFCKTCFTQATLWAARFWIPTYHLNRINGICHIRHQHKNQ